MSLTKQSQSIAFANRLLANAGALHSVYAEALELATLYTTQGHANTLKALPTAALNTDGSLGAADATPVIANPIDTRVIANLNRAISSNKLIAAKGVLDEFVAFMANAAVVTKDRNAINDDLIGG